MVRFTNLLWQAPRLLLLFGSFGDGDLGVLHDGIGTFSGVSQHCEASGDADGLVVGVICVLLQVESFPLSWLSKSRTTVSLLEAFRLQEFWSPFKLQPFDSSATEQLWFSGFGNPEGWSVLNVEALRKMSPSSLQLHRGRGGFTLLISIHLCNSLGRDL